MKKETYTKYQLECKIRELKSMHETEIEQLEKELNELKSILVEKSSECDFLTKDNRAKSEAVANACADLKNKGKELEDARAELKALKEGNKKLSDQFYEYREKLVSTSHELEGVRGALKRESEMRTEAEKKCDELRNNAWKWDKIHELMNAHGIDTMSKLKDALVELEHKREDVESLKTSLADSCAAKIKEGRDLTAKIESLGRELCSAKKAMALDSKEVNKLRRWYDNLKKLYDKARKEGEEGCAMWRESTWKVKDERDRWIDRALKDEEELRKSKERDRIAKENFEKVIRRNDELQNEVNKLQQRWTDKFNPEDELLGRTVLEWQDINVILAKHNIENSMVLGAELDMLKEYRKVLDKHCIIGPSHLDKSLEQHERFQQMLQDRHFQTIDEFSTYINELNNYKVICGQNLIGSTDELKKSLDELKTFRLSPFRSLGKEWRDVVDKYHVASANELDKCLNQRQRMHHTLHVLKKDIEQFNQP